MCAVSEEETESSGIRAKQMDTYSVCHDAAFHLETVDSIISLHGLLHVPLQVALEDTSMEHSEVKL